MSNKAWLPNLVTLTNLVLGFYAIILAVNNRFVEAAIFVFLGMILDGLDGRLARRVAIDSAIGKELDSLADLVSFGVAPALIIYQMHLFDFGILGVIVAALFPVCGAIRLARFNVMDSDEMTNYFSGLPITIAGGLLISFVLAGLVLSSGLFIPVILFVAFLMISPIKYPNFKHATSFQAKFVLVFLSACVLLTINNLSSLLMVMLVGYTCLGVILRFIPIPKVVRLFYTA